MPSKPPPLPLSHPPAVNWPTVIAAAAVSVALVACIAAWIVAHPGKSPQPEPAATLVPVVHEEAMPLLVNAPKPNRDDMRLTVNIPKPTPPPALPARVRLIELPVPAPSAPPASETYGTSVRFLSNSAEAAAQARREKKLLFVLHVSGNFEESCFT